MFKDVPYTRDDWLYDKGREVLRPALADAHKKLRKAMRLIRKQRSMIRALRKREP